MPRIAVGILPALFHLYSTTRLLPTKLSSHWIVLLYCTTELVLKKLLQCSVQGTDSCTINTTQLNYCTTAVLLCTLVYYCLGPRTDALYHYCSVVYQVLCWCLYVLLYIVL